MDPHPVCFPTPHTSYAARTTPGFLFYLIFTPRRRDTGLLSLQPQPSVLDVSAAAAGGAGVSGG
jgi:hypothetical protein